MGIYDNASWGGIGDELQKLDPRNISVDPHQAGLAARRGLENVKKAGQTVDQIASGVVAMPGQTAAGIANTAQPYFDRQFTPMEQQARGFWHGVEDFKRGFGGGGRGQQPAAQAGYPNEGRGVAPKTSPAQVAEPTRQAQGGYTPGGDDIVGSAARINPNANPMIRAQGGLAGKQVYNHYDQDRPASMGAGQNDPWKDMARQLAVFSELRNRSEPGNTGAAIMDDGTAAANAEKTRRWQMDDIRSAMKSAGTRTERAALGQLLNTMASGQNQLETEGLRGRNQLDTENMRGQNQMGAEGLRGRNQMGVESMRGQNQLETEGLRGRNQQQNTELQYGLQAGNQSASDDRAYQRALGLEQFRQNDPNTKASREAEAEERKSRARLYGIQGAAAEQEAAYAKTPLKMMNDELNMMLKMSESGAVPAEQVQQRYAELMAARNAYMRKNPQGYADGGQVESPDQLMARMREKYGLAAGAADAPTPVQRPAAPVPQPQQKPQTWAEKLRNVATGGLDRRMQGYAEGGPIDVSGRQVLGEGTPKSDSLPAIIDGEHPAALSTEEFVFPVETVRHFGLAKLNKMVEQSRKGLDTGRKSA